MDGATLTRSLRELLGEQSGSAYLDTRTSYQTLWHAACEMSRRTQALRASTTLTTVAEQTAYVLPADFLELYLKDTRGRFFLRYNDGTSNFFPNDCDYDDIVFAQNTTSQLVPDRFAIIDKPSLYDQITGTATSDGSATAGLCTLTDTAALFTTTDHVSAGDIVHNTTDASSGVVISVTNPTAITTALFDGTDNEWDTSDAYVIQPQGRLQVVLDPPPSTAGHSIYVYYLQRPAPVYHDYGVYRFPSQYQSALVNYAAWLYKYRDQAPDFGDRFYQHWDRTVRQAAAGLKRAFHRGDFSYTMRKR